MKLHKKFRIGIILFTFSILGLNVLAQYDADTVFKSITAGQVLGLKVPLPPNLAYKLESYKAHVRFSMGDIYKLGQSVNLQFNVTVKFQIGANDLYTSEIKIDLNNSSPDKLYVYNLGANPSELNYLNIRITDVSIPATLSPELVSYIRQNLQAHIEYKPVFRIDVRDSSGVAFAPVVNRLAEGMLVRNRVQTFSWDNTQTKDFPDYEFQLLRLYNISESTAADPKVITTDLDWSKALRIETESPAKDLTITIAEGSGYYVWRVRPVGNFYEGGITDKRNYGPWSEHPSDDTVKVTSSYASLYNCVFFLQDPEDSVNWTYSRVFTEQNRVSEMMTYANGLSQVKQSQRFLPSRDTTLVSQTIQDYSGRPALTTLPVPAKGGISSYKKNFLTRDSLYTARDFDLSTNYRNPLPADSMSYFEYYSDSNKDLFIPSAQGYAYSRTLYEDAPEGRAIEQSGAGKIHAIGEQTDGRGRTTRIIYCKPSDEELIRIFGDEALPASAVLKTITIDPNNTASVTYTSTNGKVIATCMVYNNEDAENLKDISPNEDPSKNKIIEEIRGNFKTIHGFVSERSIILSFPSKLKIKYNLPDNSQSIGCTRVDADCEYVVRLSVNKLGTDSVWDSGDIILKKVSGKDTTWVPQNKDFTKGTYVIRKEIRSNANRLHPKVYGRIDESLDPVRNVSDVIYNWLSKIKEDRQMISFYYDIQKFSDLLYTHDYKSIREFPFKLGGVSLPDTAYILNTMDGKNYITVEVTPKFKGDTIYPKMITINGGCCGPVVIPVIIQPQTVCYSTEEMKNDTTLTPDFWGYLKTTLIKPFGQQYNLSMTNVTGKKNIIAGYDSIALNKMIYYMLTDAYYTGPTIYREDLKRYVKPDSTEILEKDKKIQYTCGELWNCWKSIVNSYADIMKNDFTKKVGSVDQTMKEDEAEAGKKPGEKSTKDDHFDKGGKRFGNFFLKYILGIDLSKKMKQAEHINLDDTTSTGDSIKFEFKIMDQFLNCAGYRFAGIVEKVTDPATGSVALKGVLEEDMKKGYGYTNSRYYYESPDFIFRNDPDVKFPSDTLVLPYIKNPMFAFKYFQYDNDTTITRSKSRKWLDVEVANCFDDYSTMNLCDNFCGKRNHLNWTAYERYIFYNILKVKKEPDEETSSTEIVPPTLNLDSIALVTFNELRAKCTDICSKRRDEIEKLVRQAFDENCYVLNGCPADSNVVMERDIRDIISRLMNHCSSGCDTIFAISRSMGYPKVEYPSCLKVNDRGTAWVSVQGEPMLKVLPDSLKHKYDVYENWKFVFALDDKYSRCRIWDPFTGSILNREWLVLDNDSWDKSEIYTSNALVMSSRGSGSTKAIYSLRNDIADNFDVSVKVNSFTTENDTSASGLVVMPNENSPDSSFVRIGITSGNRLFVATDTIFANRLVFNGSVTLPCYLRIKRDGNAFSAFYRYENDSTNWILVGQVNASIPYHPVVGLFATSGSMKNTVKIVFDDFNGGKKLPNRLNNNINWIHNTVKSYPVYDSQGFPKKYTEAYKTDVVIKPETN